MTRPSPGPADAGALVVGDARAWLAVAAVLAAGALVVGAGAADRWNWQPGLAFEQPWRWFTAAWVHLSSWHLVANLAGLMVIALLGWRAGVTRYDALAWCAAWPLTHLALLAQPALQRYGGLSGVLHAGVIVIALRLVRSSVRRERLFGAAVLVGVTIKLLLEEPWHGALRHTPAWDFAVAPGAHVAGAVAGAICALGLARRSR